MFLIKENTFMNITSHPWISSLFLISLCMTAVLIGYHETFKYLSEILRSNGAFSYGYLVIPISVWLIWRQRTVFAILRPNPNLIPLILIFLLGLIWLTSSILQFKYIEQLSAIGLLIAIVWCILGNSVFKPLAFPLCFLLYLAPPVTIHNQLVPIMMDITSDITEILLEKTGVVFNREGTTFYLSTGSWYVAPACSGTQYLISSIIMGSVFAYIAYKSWIKRVAFISISILIPIIGNSLRVYGTIMLGHMRNIQSALYFDHVFYGLIFFGLMMTGTLFIGSFWWEEERGVEAKPKNHITREAINNGYNKIFNLNLIKTGVLAVLLIAIWPAFKHEIQEAIPAANKNLKIPLNIGGWSADFDRSLTWYPVITKATSERFQTYKKGNNKIMLYIGELKPFSNISDISPFGSIRNLEGQMKIIRRRVLLQNHSFDVNERDTQTIDLKSGKIQPLLAWYWFHIDKTNTVNSSKVKVIEALSAIKGAAKPVYLVILVTPIKHDIEESRRLLLSFLHDTLPGIENNL